ncbi:MAG: dihydrofolate reductase family protein [Fimbriimonadaceae bacterium]
MRKLIVAEHISLDGVIQAPGGPEEDQGGEFQLGGWISPYADSAIFQSLLGLLAEPFELLLGRRTYDIWAPYWPTVAPGNPIGDPFNAARKHVATHRPDSLAWNPSSALVGDIAEAVRALKATEVPSLMCWGSSDLLRQLWPAGLVDRLHLFVYPVVLGQGKRLFGEDSHPSAFTLSEASLTAGSVQVNIYDRCGDARGG